MLLLAFALVWVVAFILIKFVESLTDGRLSRALLNRNITLRLGYVSFYTTRFNKRVELWSTRHRHLCHVWFSIGAVCGLLGLLLSLFLLVGNVVAVIAPPYFSHGVDAKALFAQRPRVPFHSAPPWWLPRQYWALLAAADHRPSAFVPRAGGPDLLRSAEKWRIDTLRPPGGGGPRSPPEGRPPPPRRPPPPGRPGGPRRPPPPPRPPGRGPPSGGPGGGGGCDQRRSEYRKEVGRVIDVPGWIGRDRTRKPPRPGRSLALPVTTRQHILLRRGRQFLSVRVPAPEQPADAGDDAADADVRARDAAELARGGGAEQGVREADEQPRAAARPPLLPPGQPDANLSQTNDLPLNKFLTPLVPGLTVPIGDVWYMLIAVLIAAIVHELGHAVAAAAQHARVSGMGAFLALVLPGAFVTLAGVEDMTPRSQLRVYCAGAWHNLISAMIALATVAILPRLVAPAFVVGGGALVVDVPEISPLIGHVSVGDVVLGMGPYVVRDGGDSFRNAVTRLVDTRESVGFCISNRVLRNASDPTDPCCNDTHVILDAGHSRLQCFRVLDDDGSGADGRTCIDASVISGRSVCRHNDECRSPLRRTRSKCYFPVLAREQQLVDMRVRSAASGEILHFFYEGYPHILGQALSVSSYVPRGWHIMPLLARRAFAVVDTPNMVERLLQYLCSISLGLAILNMAPVLYLDGEASSELFVRVLFAQATEKRVKQIRAGVVLSSSMLLMFNLVVSMLMSIRGALE